MQIVSSYFEKLLCRLTIVLFWLSMGNKTNAQDLHFSQFTESPLTLNPALCGTFNGNVLAEINYRNQWSSVMGSGNGFNTMGATAEFHNIFKNWTKGYLSPGLSFFSDKSGDVKMGTTEVALTLSSGIFLSSKSNVSVGLQGAWAQQSINNGAGQWGEQFLDGSYDPSASTGEPSIGNSISYADFSGGVNYKYSSGEVDLKNNNEFKMDFGAAIFHINQPNISYYRTSSQGSLLYMRYIIHGNFQCGVQRLPISLIPGFVYYMQGPSQELNTGIKIRYYVLQADESKYTGFKKGGNAFDLGVYYRWNDSMIFLLGMKMRDYTMGISYDINVSELNVASSGRGAIELSLKYIQ